MDTIGVPTLFLAAWLASKQPVRVQPEHGGGVKAVATWYGDPSRRRDRFHGRKTANGERMDGTALTAAHRRYPFGTRLRVTNPATGLSVLVRVNDRGPYSHANLDLSYEAARRIGMVKAGTQKVYVHRVSN